MSRSYKKTPLFCDSGPWWKKHYNRRFRRYKGPVQNGNWYRKYGDPWNICDYKFGCYSRREVEREVDEMMNPAPHERWWRRNPALVTPVYRYFMK